ncbi:unnamed protein product [Trichogramma brassicae]|uniref:Uncharacterized protein n=1 Tax=Trichogramma brassicae TaxID=86971 RepID=A0A6H5INF9_9HYME|nr:unnamed protein product [Trichogramma brassicae]
MSSTRDTFFRVPRGYLYCARHLHSRNGGRAAEVESLHAGCASRSLSSQQQQHWIDAKLIRISAHVALVQLLPIMSSRKSAQERKKSGSSRHQSSDFDEVEDISSQSFADDSDRHSRRMHKDKRSSTSEKHKRKTDIDSEDEYVDDPNHNVHKKKRHKNIINRNRERVQKVCCRTMFLAKKLTRLREKMRPVKDAIPEKETTMFLIKAAATETSPLKTIALEVPKRNAGVRVRISNCVPLFRVASSQLFSGYIFQGKPEELPITEILKKAQEQRTKYEEPLPLPELTTDTMYVQRQSGFSAIRISGQSQNKHSRRNSENPNQPSSTRPIEVAIFFQRIWTSAGFIFQGLLGGMAMLHLIFVRQIFI